LLQPFLQRFEIGVELLRIFFLMTLGAALYAISDNKRRFVIGLILGLTAVAIMGSSYVVHEARLLGPAFIISDFLLIFVAVHILRYVLKAGQVTADKIYGAVCVYLLIGMIWTGGYFVSEMFSPGSLQLDGVDLTEVAGSPEAILSKCLYYSYVTLTTLGYGDIKPTQPPTQALAYVEAITGQLYLAVLVARLVALHIAHSGRK
jgi:hypothetical protein